MAVLPLKFVGDQVLRRKADRVTEVDKPLARLLDDLLDTMYAARGVGLAGPQVGISRRIIVIDTGDGPIQLVNPRIVDHKGRALGPEGCLSIPDIYGEVERWKNIVVKGLNAQGEPVVYEADGLLSVVLQHEIDHLDGRLFTDLAVDLMDRQFMDREEE